MHPSEYPSQSPTYFDGFFVGDYKYSFRNSSHGFWLLCHGQWLAITEYSMLFNEMGYLFGYKHNQGTNIAYFRLPDARDAVMGVIGSSHQINENVGNETHVLSESEMPQHLHRFGSGGDVCNTISQTGEDYLAASCNMGTDNSYSLKSAIDQFMFWKTSDAGDNQSFSLMQPTKFIGSLFVYSGVMH